MDVIDVDLKPFKFAVGEVVIMKMGRSVYWHFHNEKAKITSRYRCPSGEELYRLDPINKSLQQNVRFVSGNLVKI